MSHTKFIWELNCWLLFILTFFEHFVRNMDHILKEVSQIFPYIYRIILQIVLQIEKEEEYLQVQEELEK